MPKVIADRVIAECKRLDNPVVACLGLAYKSDVADLRESPAIAVIKHLQRRLRGQILVVEPFVSTLPADIVDDGATKLVDLDDGLAAADVVVLLTDHSVFADISPEPLASKVVIDSRGTWDRSLYNG